MAAIGLFRYQMTVSLIIGELLMIHATVVAIMVLALGVTARPLPAADWAPWPGTATGRRSGPGGPAVPAATATCG